MRILPNLWQDGHGKISSVSSMHSDHLLNTVRLLRRAGCIEEDDYLMVFDLRRERPDLNEELSELICSPQLERMVVELNARGLKEKEI